MTTKRTAHCGTCYDTVFFDRTERSALRSARIVLPIVFEWTGHPASVIDVGCGTGAWLSVCRNLGVGRILGIDGDYVDPTRLLIPETHFRAADLTQPPVDSGERFDLAICLEVAEHLPPGVAFRFIAFLTSLSDSILFSAAMPGQGGVNHLNEQPPPYWRELFRRRGFLMLDPIRPRIWQDLEVDRFYSQNVFLFFRSSVVLADPRLDNEYGRTSNQHLTILYDNLAWGKPTVSAALRALGGALARSAKWRLGISRDAWLDSVR